MLYFFTFAADMNYYQILAVPPRASMEEVRQAYRQAVKKYHPDRHPDNPAPYEERFKQIQAAYEILSDPLKRSRYDQQHGIAPAPRPKRKAESPPKTSHRTNMPPAQVFRAKTIAAWEIWKSEFRVVVMLLIGTPLFGAFVVLTSSPHLRQKLIPLFILLTLLLPAWRLFHLHYRRAILEVRFQPRSRSLLFLSKFGFRKQWFQRQVRAENIGYSYKKEPLSGQDVITLRVYQMLKKGGQARELMVLRPGALWTAEQIRQFERLLRQVAPYRRK